MNEEAEAFRRVTMKVLRRQLNSINIMDLIGIWWISTWNNVALLSI